MGLFLASMTVIGLSLSPAWTRDNAPYLFMSSIAFALLFVLGGIHRAFRVPPDRLTPLCATGSASVSPPDDAHQPRVPSPSTGGASGTHARLLRAAPRRCCCASIALVIAVWSDWWPWGTPAAPRQEWRAAVATVGPAIDHVLIEGHRATSKARLPLIRIMFAAGGGYESCDFRKNGRFTATVETATWKPGPGLDITVVDTAGNRLLTAHVDGLGVAQFPPDRIFFGNHALKPDQETTLKSPRFGAESGERLPLTVSLSLPPTIEGGYAQ